MANLPSFAFNPPVFSSTDDKSGSGSFRLDEYFSGDPEDEEDNQQIEKQNSVKEKDSKPLSASEKKKERNRILARETRQRKKFFFESLQEEVRSLVKVNNHLKSLARSLEPSVAESILKECCAELPDIVASIGSQATSMLSRADFSLISTICSAQRSFCITDPALPDNPIVFASQGFLDLTGYSMNEILGRNCRFLQGPATDLTGVSVLHEGVSKGIDSSVILLNYRKDGSTFWNQIYLSALRDVDNNVVNFVGVQVEVNSPSPKSNENRGSNESAASESKKIPRLA